MSRTKKHPLTGAKRVSGHCKNHGECPWCTGNRTYNTKRKEEQAGYFSAEQLEEWSKELLKYKVEYDMDYEAIRDEIMAIERRVKENGKFTSQDAIALTQLSVPLSRIFAAVDYQKLQEQLTKHLLIIKEE